MEDKVDNSMSYPEIHEIEDQSENSTVPEDAAEKVMPDPDTPEREDQNDSCGTDHSGTQGASNQKESKCQCCKDFCGPLACNQTNSIENSGNRSLILYYKSVHRVFILLLVILALGGVFTAISVYTINANINPGIKACKEPNSNFYMCPTCNGDCDFWYFRKTPYNFCLRKLRLIFDNPLIWFYCVFVLSSSLILSCIMMRKYMYSSNYQKLDEQGGEAPSTGAPENESSSIKMTPEDKANKASSKETPENKTDDLQVAPKTCKCCLYVVTLIFITAVATAVSIGVFFGYFLFTLLVERQLRRFLHENNVDSLSISVTVIVLDFVLAVVQGGIKMGIGNVYKNTMDCYLNENNYCSRFVLFWIFGSITAYFPIAYRIFLHGSIAGDPTFGYSNIGYLRWPHCPSIGCFDVPIYIIGSLLVTSGASVVSIIKKACSNRCSLCMCGESSGERSIRSCCRGIWCFVLNQKKTDVINYYIDLNEMYGFTVLFLTTAGIFPAIFAVIALVLGYSKIRYICRSDGVPGNKILKDYAASIEKIWQRSFLIITISAMFTNIAFVIPNSRFIYHIAHSTRDGYHPTLNFDGYLNRVLPQHNLTRLIEIRGFPNFNAHYLTVRDSNGNTVKNALGESIIYLPFVDFDCLNRGGFYSGKNFTRKSYIAFTDANSEDNPIVQYRGKQAIAPGRCFNFSSQCRSRGFLKNTEDSRQLHVVRSAFVATLALPVLITAMYVIVLLFCWLQGRSTSSSSA